MMLTALTGLLAGAFHVLSGPDHLAAVAPLAVSSDDRHAWREGWQWGLGHTAGVIVVALVALALRELLPSVETLSSWSERIVGVALLGVGLWSLTRALRIGPLVHAHGPVAHDHTHVQRGPGWIRRIGHPHASFALGVLHGAAGSSHVLGIVPALALPSASAAVLYLGAFGCGSIAAMAGFAATVGRLKMLGTIHLERRLMAACGVLAMVVGAAWLLGAAI